MTATSFFEISGPDALRAFYRSALGLPVGDPAGNRIVLPPWTGQPAG